MDFATTWSGLRRPLRAYLLARGVRVDDVDDVVQDAALRLFVAWPRVDTSTSVEPLARTIALNVWRDRVRSRAAYDVPVSEVPDAPDLAAEVERRIVARDELARVLNAVARLPREDRRVIAEATARALGAPAGTATATADRMRLMRSRRALRATCGSGEPAAAAHAGGAVPCSLGRGRTRAVSAPL